MQILASLVQHVPVAQGVTGLDSTCIWIIGGMAVGFVGMGAYVKHLFNRLIATHEAWRKSDADFFKLIQGLRDHLSRGGGS